MTWYSYFLLNIPEAFSMLILVFVLLGIPIMKNRKPIILFSFVYGGFAYILNLFMTNSLKPLLLLIVFSILVTSIFKMKFVNGFIIALFAFVVLLMFELTFLSIYVKLAAVNYEVLLKNTEQRLLASICSIVLPKLVLAWVLKKLNVTVKTPLFFK